MSSIPPSHLSAASDTSPHGHTGLPASPLTDDPSSYPEQNARLNETASDAQSLSHPLAEQEPNAIPLVAVSRASLPLDTTTTSNASSNPSSDNRGPRSRTRVARINTDGTRADSATNEASVDQEEKQQQQRRRQRSSSADQDSKRKPPSRAARHWTRFAKFVGLTPLPWYISWIPPCFTWPKLKPVIRSALVAWICMVIFLIRPAEAALGSASFLILVGCVIQPAEAPLAAVVEREFFTLLFLCAAWTWSIIAIAISHAARRNKLTPAQTSIAAAIRGDYIEAGPSIICAFFLSIGSAVLLYTKIRFGPSPFLFASVLSCILMNICLTYAPLYPFPFYTLGQSVVVPLALKAAITILLSIVFFPKSVNSQFVERLVAVLNPIADACGDQIKLLQTSPLDTPSSKSHTDDCTEGKEGFDFDFVRNKLSAAEGGLVPMAMSSRLLTREISFGLVSGDELKALEALSRSLIAPADGWAYYYTSIRADILSAHFPKTPVPSRLATPAISPRSSIDNSRDACSPEHASQTTVHAEPTSHQSSHHHAHPLQPPSRPQSLSSTPRATTAGHHSAPTLAAHHDGSLLLAPASGTSTPRRESPLHSEVFPHESSHAAAFRQLDEHPSVEPGSELTSSRFRRMTRSIAAASQRSSSPRRWIHHGHNSSTDIREHTRDHHGHHHMWDRSSHFLQNFIQKHDSAPVAIWESIRFGDLEAHLHTAAANVITEMFAQLIRETSSDLLIANTEAIRHMVAWLKHLNSHRYTLLRERLFLPEKQRLAKGHKQAEETRNIIASVEAKLTEFKQRKRLGLLRPFRDALKAPGDAALGNFGFAAELDLRTGPGEVCKIHHRYLYQAWLHQFHTISFTERLLTLLRKVETIQTERTTASVWYPRWPRIFNMDAWRNSSGVAQEDNEPDGDPEHIPDITNDTPVASRQRSRSSQTVAQQEPSKAGAAHTPPHAHFCSDIDDNSPSEADTTAYEPIVDLGSTRRRDPDALDPEGFLQIVGNKLYFWSRVPFHGYELFGVKAAVLIALVSLPAYVKSSAGWCYENRGIWAIFMAQLTLARFRGETAFALLSRLTATVMGAAFALIIWYISTGNGRGNAYGLGATSAVAFPMLMLVRIHFPGPPLTPIIIAVTTMLIIGYSWKDVTNPSPGSPGYGWEVAWRRVVAVAIGVSAAYIFTYLPPSSTLRQYQRLSHAACIAELGKNYCAVVSIASHPHPQQNLSNVTKTAQVPSQPASRRPSLHSSEAPAAADVAQEHQLLNVHASSELVRKRLIAIRAKLRRLSMISVNVSYEFSLRGRWPAARYRELFDVQMQISKLLQHCLAVLERLGPAYSIALLRRTRFLDPRFLGDVVSVISMCSTALKTGEPLPQITPCPLVDRFMDTPHGFNAYLPTQEGMAHTAWDEILATLPSKITLSMLEDEEYMTFSVGVATLFGLVVRIDKLCIAVKELVGESYAVPADVHRMLSTRDNDH